MSSPSLTEVQKDLQHRIQEAQDAVTVANRAFGAAVEARTKLQMLCTTHVATPLGAGGAICAICMQHLGWFCEESPDHMCHYSKDDPADEFCIHCGDPEERK